jgi:hypothetical protein
MHTQLKSTITNYKMAYQATVLAHVDALAFTPQWFAHYFGYKLNRHTRGVLNAMVENNLLEKRRMLDTDGHYRMVYAADFNHQRKVMRWPSV